VAVVTSLVAETRTPVPEPAPTPLTVVAVTSLVMPDWAWSTPLLPMLIASDWMPASRVVSALARDLPVVEVEFASTAP